MRLNPEASKSPGDDGVLTPVPQTVDSPCVPPGGVKMELHSVGPVVDYSDRTSCYLSGKATDEGDSCEKPQADISVPLSTEHGIGHNEGFIKGCQDNTTSGMSSGPVVVSGVHRDVARLKSGEALTVNRPFLVKKTASRKDWLGCCQGNTSSLPRLTVFNRKHFYRGSLKTEKMWETQSFNEKPTLQAGEVPREGTSITNTEREFSPILPRFYSMKLSRTSSLRLSNSTLEEEDCEDIEVGVKALEVGGSPNREGYLVSRGGSDTSSDLSLAGVPEIIISKSPTPTLSDMDGQSQALGESPKLPGHCRYRRAQTLWSKHRRRNPELVSLVVGFFSTRFIVFSFLFQTFES